MMPAKLTKAKAPASFPETGKRGGAQAMGRLLKTGVGLAGAMVLCGALGGCINVAAPDEPIVIELNINIRQEVIYRLAEDAANTVEDNADIF